MLMHCPVIAEAESEARTTHISPTSLPVGNLLRAVCIFLKPSINSDGSWPLAGENSAFSASTKPSVSMSTGHKAFTLIPLLPSSFAKD